MKVKELRIQLTEEYSQVQMRISVLPGEGSMVHKQICFPEQHLESYFDLAFEQARRELKSFLMHSTPSTEEKYKQALVEIAKIQDCLGPDCPWCENNEAHPYTEGALLAQKTLLGGSCEKHRNDFVQSSPGVERKPGEELPERGH